MKKIKWELQYLSPPPAIRYCSKCGKKMNFKCSDKFRVNAHKKQLDIWLIYKCSVCETTWNAAVYSGISPRALNPALLDGFHGNDKLLAARYAFDAGFIRRNGSEPGIPDYTVTGELIKPGAFSETKEPVELEIISEYPAAVKVSALIRNSLNLSQKTYAELVVSEKITAEGKDLMKCRLNRGIIMIFR